MSITATVENDTIKLPVHVPDGTRVEITLPERESAGAAHGLPTAPAKVEPASFFDSIRDLIGAAEGLPEDFAAEHDHYIHGTRKRAGR